MAKRSTLQVLGFTLVELLTVVAIITLLIAILIPALSRSRTQTHRARTAAKLRCLDISLALFHDEWNRYPVSSRCNPFEHEGPPLPAERLHVQGAQSLFMELIGVDCCGYVKPHILNDTNDDGRIDWEDWLSWYSGNPTIDCPRFGPYLELV